MAASRFTNSLALAPDAKTLAWIVGPTVNFTDLEAGQPRPGPAGHTMGLKNAFFTPDGKAVLTRGSDAAVLRRDPATGKLLGRIEVPGQALSYLLSNDGRLLVTGEAGTGVIQVFDAATGKKKQTIEAECLGFGYSFSLSPDGKLIAVVGRLAGTAQLYDVDSGQKVQNLTLPPPTGAIGAMTSNSTRRLLFTPDSRLIAIAADGRLAVWDTVFHREVQRLEFPAGAVLRHAALAPDGRCAALEFLGGEMAVWELATGTRRRTFEPSAKINLGDPLVLQALRGQVDGTSYPMTLAYSDDGRLIARAGDDGVIRVWDVRTGRELGTFAGHRGSVVSLNFSPDGRRLVSGSSDTTALVWDVAPLRAKVATATNQLEPAKISGLWAALNEADAAKAHPALLALAADPNQAVPFLKNHVRPITAADPNLIANLVADLGDRSFIVREKARKELERLAELAAPALRDAAAQRHVCRGPAAGERLLEGLVHRALPADQVRRCARLKYWSWRAHPRRSSC